MNITKDNIIKPFDLDYFIQQLLLAGIPENTIRLIRQEPPGYNTGEELIDWLYKDIILDEVRIINGFRMSRVAGVFITDGNLLLLERNSSLAKLGEKYKFGGQIPFSELPTSAALREIAEETPIRVDSKNLYYLGKVNEWSEGSPKLPHVPSLKEIYHFKYLEKDLSNIRHFTQGDYIGAQGEKHNLLIKPVQQVLEDEAVKDSYKKALRIYIHIINSPYAVSIA